MRCKDEFKWNVGGGLWVGDLVWLKMVVFYLFFKRLFGIVLLGKILKDSFFYWLFLVGKIL